MQLLMLAQQCRTAEELCAIWAEACGEALTLLEAPELPAMVPSFALKHSRGFSVHYKPQSHLSSQLSILHELSHLELGHLDGEDVDLKSALEGKTLFTDSRERAAEKLACLLLCALMDCQKLSPPTTSISTRFESLLF